MSAMKTTANSALRYLRLNRVDIFEQLRLEELLLRKCSQNYFIFNQGTETPKIVLGFSGKAPELVNVELVARDWVPMIRRFTGGGTVVVDQAVDCPPYPREIMNWSKSIYGPVFNDNNDFGLSEHDYTLGDVKIGGNAQAIVKNRWCHHTSFLWSFNPQRMEYLLMPPQKKRPAYRKDREHGAFLTKLEDHMESVEDVERRVAASLREAFLVDETAVEGRTAEDIAMELGWDPSELDAKTVRTKYVRVEDFL